MNSSTSPVLGDKVSELEDIENRKKLYIKCNKETRKEIYNKVKAMIKKYNLPPVKGGISKMKKEELVQYLIHNVINIGNEITRLQLEEIPKLLKKEKEKKGIKITKLQCGTKILSVNFMELMNDKKNAKKRLKKACNEWKK